MVKHIFLVGFIGAGKTTIGAALQALTGMTLLDTDQQIAESEGKIPLVWFWWVGEGSFQASGKQLLQQLSLNNEPCIFFYGRECSLIWKNRQLMGLVGTTFTSRKVSSAIQGDQTWSHPPNWLLRQLKKNCTYFSKKKGIIKSRFYHSQFLGLHLKLLIKILNHLPKNEPGR